MLLLLRHEDIDRAADLKAELGLDLKAAEGLDGLVEHEMCPVFVAFLPRGADTSVDLQGEEVEDATWVPWASFRDEVLAGDRRISPWCREQVALLAQSGEHPTSWPVADPALLPEAARFS